MKTRFIFLLLPDVHILDLAGADQAIHEAIDFQAEFESVYCGLSREISTTSGIPMGMVPHYSTVKAMPGDFLIIPGCSYSYLTSEDFRKQEDLFRWITDLYESGVSVCSICMGAFVLAETGLLNGRICTTHFKKTRELQARYPGIRVQENILFTDQDRIYTSAGIASGIDLTLHIIEKLKGSYFAHLVARELVIFSRRQGSDSQESEFLKFRNHIHAGIHQVQDYIHDQIHQKMTLAGLADQAAMSERNLTRIFKQETGVTINAYLTAVRRAKAAGLMKNPNLSKIEIANKVGLQSEKQLTRILALPPD